MKAQAVKMISGPNGFNYVKTPKSKVFLPVELEDEVYNKIAKELPKLEKIAEITNRPIYFAPKGNNVLMNYGPFTSVIDNNTLQADMATKMYEHINKVNKLTK